MVRGPALIMALAPELRTQLRGLYVYKRLSLEAARGALGVPRTTAHRWMREARAKGDDWETARASVALGDESFTMLSRKLLEDYLVQHQATIDMLRDDKTKKLSAEKRAQLLASLADSFHKTMASFRKVAPELNKHSIALDTVERLAAFAKQKYPRHVPMLLEMLEPFGEHLAKNFN